MIRLYSDGAAKGNPGPAGAGFWAEADGQELFAESLPLEPCTNNEAEYQALIAGLERLVALGRTDEPLEVRLDSELVVHQLTGRYRVRATHLRPLYERARRLLERFPSVRIVAVPRERNKRADELANAAIRRPGNRRSERRRHRRSERRTPAATPATDPVAAARRDTIHHHLERAAAAADQHAWVEVRRELTRALAALPEQSE